MHHDHLGNLRPIPVLLLPVLLAVAPSSPAQSFPAKPLRIVTTAVGGGNDFVARLLAGAISGPLGQSVVIDNRASGVIPGETVAKSVPDGHTMLLTGSGLWIGTLLQPAPYDPLRDFTAIALVAVEPNTLVVPPSMPVKAVKDLIAIAKARPGELNYVATGTGGSLHLAAELFKAMAGVNLVRVTYKGSGAAMPDLYAGQVHMAIMGTGGVMPHVTAGKLRAVAVSGLKPTPLAPGLPTIAATLPGYEAVGITAILGPANMAPAVVNRLNQEIGRALTQPEISKKLMDSSQEVLMGPSANLVATMKADMLKWGKLIKDAGIQAQ